MMKEVQLNINTHKMKKLLKGVNVTLLHSELGTGKTYTVEKKVFTKINRAIRQNKGLRINREMIGLEIGEKEETQEDSEEDEDEMKGGKIKINLKKLVNNEGVKALEGIKKIVPKSVAKAVVGDAAGMAGLAVGAYLGNAEAGKNVGKALGKSTVEGFYDTDFKDKNALKDFGKNTGESFAKEGLKTALSGKGLINGINPRGEFYKNGNPNLKGKKSTDTIWNDNNLHKKVSGGSFLPNGGYKGEYRGRGVSSSDLVYHEARSHLMRNANLPKAYQDKTVKTGGSLKSN